MNEAELNLAARALLKDEHIMTLAGPWAAAVYYVWHAGALWFFSSESARHIVVGSITAEVHASSVGWRDIRGVQLRGTIVQQSSAGAFVKYLRRFDFISEINGAADLVAMEQAFKVKLYRFQIEECYYLDNSIKFGSKQAVKI